MSTVRLPLVVGMMMCAVCAGCADDPSVDTPPIPIYVEGTIGQFGQYVGFAERSVQGYGVVVGLGENGSGEIPGKIRDYLIQYLHRRKLGFWRHDTAHLHPAKILRDLDTAAVLVAGEVPHGAPVGSTFDLQVAALDGTNTQSLDGGVLMPAELRLAIGQMAVPGGPTHTWGDGHGEVFVNPLLDMSKPAMKAELRRGRIIGGGRVTRYRPVRLLLSQPSYRMAREIESRINQRFGDRKERRPPASAKSDETVEISVPRAYAGDYRHFLELILHLPLARLASRNEIQTQRILKAMTQPDAQLDRLSLSLEAIGGDIVPMLQPSYASGDPQMAYYTARAGLRLGDKRAGSIVLRTARTAETSLQVPAIEELGRHKLPGAIETLRGLLNDENWLVRVAAYEGLIRCGDTQRITRIAVGKRFMLDMVRSAGSPVIYATQVGQARIAVFGGDLPVSDPVFFTLPDELVTISDTKRPEGKKLMLYRKVPRSTTPSDMLYADFKTSDLIRTLGGLAERNPKGTVQALSLTYSQVLQVVRGLCVSETGGIKARFELQPLGESGRIRQGDGMGIRPDTPEG